MTAAAISVEALVVERGGRRVVDGVTLRLHAGESVAIVGPNGAGKSSLLDVLAGRLAPAAGRIEPGTGARIGWLPQRAEIDRSFPIRVDDFAAMGLWPRRGAFGGLQAADRARRDAVLAEVGLDGHRQRLIGELSVGQFQRLLFARLLLQDADLWLLDEPFAALDERSTASLLGLLAGWRAAGRTIVCVLHESALVQAHCDEVLLLARTPVAWGPPAQVLTPEAWREARRRLAEDGLACAAA